MAITSLSGVINGMLPAIPFSKNIPYTNSFTVGFPGLISLYGSSGFPGAGSNPSSGATGSVITSRTGQIPFTNPAAGKNTYLARLEARSNYPGTLFLVDRLWDNQLTVTSNTNTINSPTWPSRDSNGAASGAGVVIGMEVISPLTFTSGSSNFDYAGSISYTGNVSGSGKTATNNINGIYGLQAGAFKFLTPSTSSGDSGVSSVQSFTSSNFNIVSAGAISLVALRILATLEIQEANKINAIDAFTSGMVQLYNNTCPFFLFAPYSIGTSGNYQVSGHVIYSQG